MKNRLVHVPNDLFQQYMSFAEKHPKVVDPGYMLQKLTIFDFVQPILATRDHRDILEIGCGTGVHSALLSRFGKVASTELEVPGSFAGAEQDVDRHRERVFAELAKGPIEFRYNDGKTLPFADASFDVVFHNSVIEHVDDAVRFNREVARVLRPGGIAIGITGTPLFCWFRLVRGSLMLLPLNLARSVYREIKPTPRRPKVSEQLKRLGGASAQANGLKIDVRAFYSRLAHFVDSPEYNRVLIENAAAEHGVSVEKFLAHVAGHFDASILNRLAFYMTPQTHGQHYRGVFDEMRQWSIDRWIERSEAAGLASEEIIPFRFHHLFEPTINIRLNSRLYHRFAKLIHEANRRRVAPPTLASEFILVSRKPAQPAAA